jgi:putative heme-binding domain-containing protein
LAALILAGVEVPDCATSLERLPRSAWNAQALEPLSNALTRYLETIPAAQRTEAQFTEVLRFANELASALPSDSQKILTRTLRNLGPIVVTLRAVYEQMRFDKDTIVVATGRPVVIVFQNDDAMPHNVAVLAPGAQKEIGLAAEKMTPEPDGEGRLYIPASPKVLAATKLVAPGQKLQLAFNAPADEGDYPFICTFPGHWLRMAGILTVTRDLEAYLASHALAQKPKLTDWKLADFLADLPQATTGRDLNLGRELFSNLACIQCHKLGANGYAFGPDLTEVFVRYKADRAAVLQQILEPSKVIEDRYRNFNFDLKAGEPVLGVVIKEDDQSVTIQGGPADSLIQTLKKSEIQQRRPQPSSPMPVGLLNALSKPQIFDLLAYIESGGKPPPPHDHHF